MTNTINLEEEKKCFVFNFIYTLDIINVLNCLLYSNNNWQYVFDDYERRTSILKVIVPETYVYDVN